MRSNPHFFYYLHCELFNDWPGRIVNFLIIKKLLTSSTIRVILYSESEEAK